MFNIRIPIKIIFLRKAFVKNFQSWHKILFESIKNFKSKFDVNRNKLVTITSAIFYINHYYQFLSFFFEKYPKKQLKWHFPQNLMVAKISYLYVNLFSKHPFFLLCFVFSLIKINKGKRFISKRISPFKKTFWPR